MLREECPDGLGRNLAKSKEALERVSHESNQSLSLLPSSSVILSHFLYQFLAIILLQKWVTIFSWNKCGEN